MTRRLRTKILFATAVVVLLLLPSFANAAGQSKGNTKAWYEQEAVQQKLDLTEDQVARIAEVEETFRPQLAKMNQEKRAAYRTMMTSLDAGELPEDEFEANRTRLELAYGSHAARSADLWRALRSVLTEAQWRKLPEAAPKALTLGYYSVAKRGGVYMGPGRSTTTPNTK